MVRQRVRKFPVHSRPAWVMALVTVGLLTALSPAGAAILFNADIHNTTGLVVDDYHVKLVANGPINVTNTYEHGGNVAFDDALSGGGVSGNGTNSVTINWSGATVNPGDTVHVGASGHPAPSDVRIVESWWTLGGARVSAGTDGLLASARFNGVAGDPTWVVVQVRLFADPDGDDPIGTIWLEGEGTSAEVFNGTCEFPIFASWSFREPGPQVALDDLNPELEGFGPWTPVVQLDPESPADCDATLQ